MAENISEADLQKWFEDKSRQQMIVDFIVNQSELDTIPKSQRYGMKDSERVRLQGLDNARKVLERLRDAKHLSGNRSVSDKGYTQMRPDLILISEDANYMLVELKTNKEAERQAVQELLAYSTAMKIQLPFTNEFMFIIVAFHWGTLLRFSVKSLILDGKLVLPLGVELGHNGEYQLRILKSLFDSDFNVSYDPFYAMVPHTLATNIYLEDNKGNFQYTDEVRSRVKQYFRRMAVGITTECRKSQQSGFVILWKNFLGYRSDIISLTVVTVNQFWQYSEHNSDNLIRNKYISNNGIKRVQQNAADLMYDEVYARADFKDEILNDLNSAFLEAEAYQAEASLYAQSSLSSDLIERYRYIDHREEEAIRETGLIQQFESGGENNLKSLLSGMQNLRCVQIELLSAFGDVGDFLRQKNLDHVLRNINFATFQKIMESFQTSKLDN